ERGREPAFRRRQPAAVARPRFMRPSRHARCSATDMDYTASTTTGSFGGRVRGTMGGALAGAAATVPMSAFMELAHRELPFWERHSLPPRKMDERRVLRVGVRRFLREP